MTKYEIEIDLPADVLAKYEPVEVRRARHGDVFFTPNGEVTTWLQRFETGNPHIILRPRATWDEWPVWLTAEAYAEDADGHKYFYEKVPTRAEREWDCEGSCYPATAFTKCTNLTLPTYDGPWEHSLIRNPHLDKAEPVAVDKDPVASEQKTDRCEWWIIEPGNVGAEAYACEQWGTKGEPIQPQAHAREVIPGDPDPVAAKRLIEAVEKYRRNQGPSVFSDMIQALAAAKRGQ